MMIASHWIYQPCPAQHSFFKSYELNWVWVWGRE
jgi:hypothetical protein